MHPFLTFMKAYSLFVVRPRIFLRAIRTLCFVFVFSGRDLSNWGFLDFVDLVWFFGSVFIIPSFNLVFNLSRRLILYGKRLLCNCFSLLLQCVCYSHMCNNVFIRFIPGLAERFDCCKISFPGDICVQGLQTHTGETIHNIPGIECLNVNILDEGSQIVVG